MRSDAASRETCQHRIELPDPQLVLRDVLVSERQGAFPSWGLAAGTPSGFAGEAGVARARGRSVGGLELSQARVTGVGSPLGLGPCAVRNGHAFTGLRRGGWERLASIWSGRTLPSRTRTCRSELVNTHRCLGHAFTARAPFPRWCRASRVMDEPRRQQAGRVQCPEPVPEPPSGRRRRQ